MPFVLNKFYPAYYTCQIILNPKREASSDVLLSQNAIFLPSSCFRIVTRDPQASTVGASGWSIGPESPEVVFKLFWPSPEISAGSSFLPCPAPDTRHL